MVTRPASSVQLHGPRTGQQSIPRQRAIRHSHPVRQDPCPRRPRPRNTGDDRYTTAEGSLFNSQLAAMRGSETHNPFLIEALLTASIQQVEIEYGISPAPGTVLDNILGRGGHP